MTVAVKTGWFGIQQEGRTSKFVQTVEHRTFRGRYARIKGEAVLQVTERRLFSMGEETMELMGFAIGIDLEKDILARIEFKPMIKGNQDSWMNGSQVRINEFQ